MSDEKKITSLKAKDAPSTSNRRAQEDAEDLDNLEENDEIIGVAIRRSLLVVAAVGVIVALGFLGRGLFQPEPEDSAIELSGPVAVDGGASEEPPVLRFDDTTAESGIDFVHENGAEGNRFLPETMGGGVAFVDFDRDGDQDLVFVNSREWAGGPAGTSRLYINDGTGHFVDGTKGSGLDFVAYGTGIAVGDYDNDGFPDLFIAAVGRNRLLHKVSTGANLSKGTGRKFVDVTATAGVAGEDDRWSSSSAFFDADNDGDLDLYVGNYVEWSKDIDLDLDYRLAGVGRAYGQPVNYQGTYSYFYRNRGDGTFEEVSEASGMRISNSASGEPVAKSLGLAPGDVDQDGWIDLVEIRGKLQVTAKATSNLTPCA